MRTSPLFLFSIALTSLFMVSCNQTVENTDLAITGDINNADVVADSDVTRDLSEDFKQYWYSGKAEITSYQLTQARYGELREGTAVNVFVTEDFLPEVQVKADRYSEKNIPVLKLNNTKKFLTGIYPYSVMTSSFSPVKNSGHAIKVTHSMQEWCGQVYIQLNNKKNFEVMSHSYFEGEADQKISLPKTWLENEIWNMIRIAPDELPMGEIDIIPSFEFTRMRHVNVSAVKATASSTSADGLTTYTLDYPELNRSIAITYSSEFPYEIERWEEKHPNGLITTAEKIKRIRSAYWGQNSNKDLVLRDSLGL